MILKKIAMFFKLSHRDMATIVECFIAFDNPVVEDWLEIPTGALGRIRTFHLSVMP